MKFPLFIRLFATVSIAASALLMSGCKNRVTLYHPDEIFIKEQRLSEAEILDAIYKGSSQQGWEITEEGPDYVICTSLPDSTASFNGGAGSVRRKATPHVATLRIDFDRYSLNFEYVSSENVRYEFVTDGKQAVHRRYNDIVSNLEQSIRHEIQNLVNI